MKNTLNIKKIAILFLVCFISFLLLTVIGVINIDTNSIDSYLFSIRKRIGTVSEVADRLSTYREENESLRKENADLLSKLSKLQGLEIENEKLSSQIGSKVTLKENKVLASVTSMNNYLTPTEITINVGKISGVAIGNSVILNDFLVGKVSEVGENKSQVTLLSSNKYSYIVTNKELSAKGNLTLNSSNELIMSLVLPGEVIKIGDLIVTDSSNTDVMKNLIIGEVSEIRNSQNGFNKDIVIKRSLDYSKLDLVFVVLSK